MSREETSPPSGRLGPGEGSIDELPSGKFRVRIRLPDGSRRSKTFNDHESANAFRRGALAIYAERSAEDEAETFGAYGLRWLDRRELAGEHRAMDSQRSVWRRHVDGSDLAGVAVKSVTRRDVRLWVEGMKTKKATVTRRKGRDGAELVETTRPLSRSTIHSALVLVRQALQAAVEEEVLASNPAREVQLGRGRVTAEKKWTFLSEKEIAAVLNAPDTAIPQADRLLYAVAIYTGMREGELWGLRWGEVTLDGEHPQVEVRYSYDGPTKTGKPRVVPLLAPARDALRAWKKLCPKSAKGLVFPTADGEMRHEHDDNGWSDRPVGQGKEKRVVPGHKTKAGIARRVRFHDMGRHTCASHLVMGSWGRAWKIEEVRDFCGHTSITTTLRYAHLSPDHLHKAAKETVKEEGSTLRVMDGSQVAEPIEDAETTREFLIRRSGVRVPSRVPPNSQGFSLEALAGRDPAVTQKARALLEAVASGEGVPSALVDDLVAEVLTDPIVDLALRAREPGPMRLTLALRLAAEILGACNALRELRGGVL